ncbi:bifunctional hydroxymethylpyrimidine kinase/phosphomethylpyrimidine kinase [Paraoerskovia marina]|uniref:bifunctional hydroxymethylpyrimidine kinase/phosphomethylpyrimidine kinase n=1 Tax=Paraoerskovia marina TaxID=545619 RepID=UPI0006936FA1|nr:bifunctional hydroxymethylpyrimidine kinase/phosphomethylpyrimidine kinase [Paraoerskovia marina]
MTHASDRSPQQTREHPPGSRPRVLSIAGTDPTGGAGIQADLKSFAAHGAYGMAVVTAVVAQNTHGVRAVHLPPVDVLVGQLEAVSDDVAVDAVKIGMVASEEYAQEIGLWLDRVQPRWVVLDPVMVATSGHHLLDPGAERAVVDLLPRVDLVTPNMAELAVLVGQETATTWSAVLEQAVELARRASVVVLAKGGHLLGPGSPDALVTPEGVVTEVSAPRVQTSNVHGTGCSLSSALAALRPRCDDWESAVREAKTWISGALEAADALAVGSGNGPIDHLHAQVPV